MKQDTADGIALKALAWLTADDELLPAFLAATGMSPAALAESAGETEVLTAVLDFILGSDGRVLAFSQAALLSPESVAEARAALPGGEQVHWT